MSLSREEEEEERRRKPDKAAWELHDACARNQLDIVKKLLSSDSELINSQPVENVLGTRAVYNYYREEKDNFYETIYVPVCKTSDEEVPVCETSYDETRRVYCGTESYIKGRIQHSAPIYVAAQNGNTKIVEYLAQFQKCDLDIVNKDGSVIKQIGSQCISSILSEMILFLLPCPIELDHLNSLIQAKLLHSSCSVELRLT